MKIAVSQTVSQADLHTPDMSRVKWRQLLFIWLLFIYDVAKKNYGKKL